jgi:hypothetical protein
MSDSKARRNPSVVASSKYARGPAPHDARRRELESLTHDADAIARAKQDFAEISRQHRSRVAPVQLDDIEVPQRKPQRVVYATVPALPIAAVDDSAEHSPAHPPQHQGTADDVSSKPVVPDQAPAPHGAAPKHEPRPAPSQVSSGAQPIESRAMFAHVEHKPAIPAAKPRPRYAEQERSARHQQMFVAAYEEPWSVEQQLRSSHGLLICALIIAVSLGVIWLLQAPKNDFIGRWGLSIGLGQASESEQPALQVAINPGEHSVVGAPSISAAAIDDILAKYGSPAAGTGQTWITLGKRYGIDPAYAVAFFIHESSAGTNPGWAGFKSDGSTTHNVGNIICAGYATCYGRFRDYANWDEGIGDWYKLISHEYVDGRGAASVEQIIPIYAPSFENDVDNYVQTVVALVDEWRQHGAAQ